MDRFGVEEVENFIDGCLSIEDLIDVIPRSSNGTTNDQNTNSAAPDDEEAPPTPGRFAAKHYLDAYVNPPEVLLVEAERLRKERELESLRPAGPARDVMKYILDNAPLKPWQADVLSIIREEAYYFAPQAQTKIMNEGWASYWHSTIMTRQGLDPADIVNYADHHSGTMASSPTRLNPYKLGIELLRDIEDRWNRGRFGKEYEECDDMRERRNWDTNAGLGRQKIFDVRRIYNDLMFIDEFLTLDSAASTSYLHFNYHDDTRHLQHRKPRVSQGQRAAFI